VSVGADPTPSGAVSIDGTPTYLATSDPDRTVTDFASKTTAAQDYFPVWLNCMADDVTLEGALMNGAVRGPDAVRTILGFIRTLYEDQHFSFAGPLGEDAFLEVYNTSVRGEPIGSVVLVTRNAAGEAHHIAASYRPRRSIVFVAQLLAEHFAGTPYERYFASD
jgi:hypothetical protein